MSAAPERLLLDEMLSPRIAEILVARGVDCVAVAADAALRASDDAAVAAYAATTGRTLATNDVADVDRVRTARLSEEKAVPRIIYTSDARFPRDRRFIDRLADALERAAREHLAERHGGVFWLS